MAAAFASAQRAVVLDGNDARCHAALAYVHFFRKSFDLARNHIDVARRLNPNDPDIMASEATLEAFAGIPLKALDLIDRARKFSPIPPNWYYETWGVALYSLKRYAEAAEVLERRTAERAYVYSYLAACYAQLGNLEKAKAAVQERLRLQPDFSLREWATVEPFESQERLNHMREGMHKAGLPE
jgi:adenylate cyclase